MITPLAALDVSPGGERPARPGSRSDHPGRPGQAARAKVTVVIPTYRPGPSIQRAIRSLDQQTMPPGDLEVIIIDDGSPDHTCSTLAKLRDTRPWMTIEKIEHSGWPSRPRNVGTDLARGEYVLYLDQDDELYPDGLQACYDFAVRHGADVVSPKECKTNDIGWGLGNFTADVPNAKPLRGISSLLPMMPHKLYRTAFLRQHGIRFPEGRRMLWEDIYFNVAAYRHAEVISILSSTPVYRWVKTGSNTSRTYGPREEEFWERLTALLDFIHQTLPGDEFADDRRSILAHQLGGRVIGRFCTEYADRDDRSWVPMARSHLDHILAELTPPELDSRLSLLVRPRARLVRQHRLDLLDELRDHEGAWIGQSHATQLQWDDGGRLTVASTARWTNESGDPLTLWRRHGRLLRTVPRSVADQLPADLLDVTRGVERATSQVTVRDRAASVTWALPSETAVEITSLTQPPSSGGDEPDSDAEPVTVLVRSVAHLDVGADRTASTWDLHAKNSLYGQVNHRAVVTDAGIPGPAVVDGRLVRVRRSSEGKLSVEINRDPSDLARLFVPEIDQLRLTTVPGGTRLTVVRSEPQLFGRPVCGVLRLVPDRPLVRRIARSVKVSKIPLARRVQKRLVTEFRTELTCAASSSSRGGDDARRGIQLTVVLRPLPGSYAMSLATGGPAASWPITLHVDALGRLRLAPAG